MTGMQASTFWGLCWDCVGCDVESFFFEETDGGDVF